LNPVSCRTKTISTIRNLAELRGIQVSENHITLGALTTYTEVQSNSILQEEFPMLCQAASETGGLAIQNAARLEVTSPTLLRRRLASGLAGL